MARSTRARRRAQPDRRDGRRLTLSLPTTLPHGRQRSPRTDTQPPATTFYYVGDLGGHGAPDGHMTGNQARKWPGKYFTPAVRRAAEQWPDEHGSIIGATPYSLRRGMISLRIRAGEDRQAIAKQSGTSVDMLERSYSFAIEDLEDEGPKPAEAERRQARQVALADKRHQLRAA
jgi:hypothetical protein